MKLIIGFLQSWLDYHGLTEVSIICLYSPIPVILAAGNSLVLKYQTDNSKTKKGSGFKVGVDFANEWNYDSQLFRLL